MPTGEIDDLDFCVQSAIREHITKSNEVLLVPRRKISLYKLAKQSAMTSVFQGILCCRFLLGTIYKRGSAVK